MEVAVQGDLDQAFALRGDERKGALCGQGPTLAVDDPERNRGEACLCVVASQDLEDARPRPPDGWSRRGRRGEGRSRITSGPRRAIDQGDAAGERIGACDEGRQPFAVDRFGADALTLEPAPTVLAAVPLRPAHQLADVGVDRGFARAPEHRAGIEREQRAGAASRFACGPPRSSRVERGPRAECIQRRGISCASGSTRCPCGSAGAAARAARVRPVRASAQRD